MKAKEKITEFTIRLISEGEDLLENGYTKVQGRSKQIKYVDLKGFNKWIASCKYLLSMIGGLANPWKEGIEGHTTHYASVVEVVLGNLESISEAIEHDLFVTIGDLVFAEAFSDLLGQAEYLFEQGYALASGVILRAVLEERLKKLCDSNNIVFEKKKPTINDYNTKLYGAKIYDQITMSSIQTMATIGNKAAHNEPDLDKNEVARFKRDLVEFLRKLSN